ncbi:hypothetical protein PsorP6_007793 [Peronosclerospora sorghi]|uniref:Uncharacterized protein n=1 Tax=Peronosclerospora sorghi TaxID=230839 RepID=A0ACC0WBI0_9STRA|nr:hypothetical protein PsorP6_007793 [Peronosclerospora sorghi]
MSHAACEGRFVCQVHLHLTPSGSQTGMVADPALIVQRLVHLVTRGLEKLLAESGLEQRGGVARLTCGDSHPSSR